MSESKTALFLHHEGSGKKKRESQLALIRLSLRALFKLTEICPESEEEARELAKNACGQYEVLIIMGGDGTFNNIASALCECENPPILGYINGGTMGDVGRTFGITRSTKKALDIIAKGFITPFDMTKIGSSYFAYMAAVGAFSDIAYDTPRSRKARFGKMAYYQKATQEALLPEIVRGHIETPNRSFDFETPFLLLLSGKKVGGFSVNPRGDFADGRIEVFLSDPGLFNGLPHYVFQDSKLERFSTNKMKITLEKPLLWCIDGEKGPTGSVEIEVFPRRLSIFCDEKAFLRNAKNGNRSVIRLLR